MGSIGARSPGRRTGPRVRVNTSASGQAAIEFLLLLALFVLPMAILAIWIRAYLVDLFDIISWFLSLPVP